MSLIPESPDSSGNSGSNRTPVPSAAPSRYESQKRRDWNTFGQYLKNHRPPLTLSRCSGAHVLEFLRYLDQFGKTKVHTMGCPFFGHPNPPAPCPCPLRQAWGSLDALIGRLRAAFEENGGQPENNPFGARAVRLFLREVRDSQAKARGIAYMKKKRKRPPPPVPLPQPSAPPQQTCPHPSQFSQEMGTLQSDLLIGGVGPNLQVGDLNSVHGMYHHQNPHHVFLHGHMFLTSESETDGGGGSSNGLIPLSVQY
ncbi:hypothetical protein ZOSMA_16G00570 [Zostera marina]|uniref:ALOG domain-containing protein n=1 Tax=Zostera marina TaxID=29655 RepID=A0A0K9PV16_ZOSMR|nr:hypothetical protein ZOSMA_16G00570 [Zostera marina]